MTKKNKEYFSFEFNGWSVYKSEDYCSLTPPMHIGDTIDFYITERGMSIVVTDLCQDVIIPWEILKTILEFKNK
jgi:hypothetical protein